MDGVLRKASQSPDPFPLQADVITINWDRRAKMGEMIWSNGFKKTLLQVMSNTDQIADFRYGPDTPVIPPDAYSPHIDCCYNAMLAFRSRGEYALTVHDISYGGVRAISQEGTCDFEPIE